MKTHWKFNLIVIIFAVLMQVFMSTPALAEVQGPGWILGDASQVTLEEAAAFYQPAAPVKAMGPMSESGGGPIIMSSSTTITPEINELARALEYSPALITNYVNHNFEYVPYFGSLKGATLTLHDRSGNDFDLSSLLVALYRASGYAADFIYALTDYDTATLANWLDVDPSDVPHIAPDVWGDGGIPYAVLDSGSGFEGLRSTILMVRLTYNGNDYFFVPTFKYYINTPKIDIGSAMSYNRADLLGAATSGATIGSDYAQNFNETALNDKLVEYATNMVDTLRSQYPNSDVRDIIGGRQVDTSSPMSQGFFSGSLWTEIPASYTTTLRIQHEGIDHTFETPDIAGKRLTMTYTDGSFAPELRLDGALIATGSSTTEGNEYDMIISIDHPYAADSGTYGDQTATYRCVSGSTYAIIADFGGTTDSLIRKREKILGQNLESGLANNSEEVLGEALNTIGFTFMREVRLSECLSAEITDAIYTRHHAIGVMAQEDSYYVDVRSVLFTGTSKNETSPSHYTPIETFFTTNSIASAFEHTILEQMVGSDNPAVSTIKLMQIANSQGDKFFWAYSGNFASIQPQLQNYSTETLTAIENYINNGHTVILPEDGYLGVNEWNGTGYASKYFAADQISGSLAMVISGGHFGGYASYLDWVEPEPVWVEAWTLMPDISYDIDIWSLISLEPVDMATGAYLHDHADISLGEKSPMGLEFSRSYNSSRKNVKRSMGYGWQHNYDIFLRRVSDGDPGLGLRTPVDAAAMITDLYIAFDLMKNEDTLSGWMTMFLAHKWAVDQLIDNAINVNIGGQVTEYIELPDGSYNKPPGITTELIDNGDGTFSIEERFGAKMDFDTNDRITQLQNIDGNTTTFTYTGDKLTSAQDTVGRTLTLGYTGDNLDSVTDSEGRSVSYSYDGNDDLVGYTDLRAKSWAYGYDTEHQITSLSNPLGITTASNVYDTLGRVMTQTVPRQSGTATYNFYFSGFRNVEEDPYGKQIIYHLDDRGRTYAVEDELDNKIVKTFDGQNHLVGFKDARLNVTNFEYDGNHSLTKITNALTQETSSTYDTQFPYRLTDITDALGHTIHYDYDAEHHLTLSTDAETNTTGFTHYPNGMVWTATDGRGTVTTLTYDSKNHPLTIKTAAHPAITYSYDPIGRMLSLTDQEGAATSFTYDDSGLLLTSTDPLVKVTTFVYDDAGRMISRTDRNGNTTTYSHTPSDRIETITYQDASTVTFTYDLHNQPIGMLDAVGTTTYTYDDVYRITSITDPHGQVVSYEYDEADNVTKIIYPDSKAVTYTYDDLNRLATVTDWQSQTATYIYDAAGRLTSVTNFNGTVTSYGYDDANRLISVQNEPSSTVPIISSYSYTLDGNGNRTQVIQEEPLAPIVNAEDTDFGYNTPKNRLLSAGSTNLAYDDEGQLGAKGSNTYSFDYEYRLVGISGADSIQFSYDGNGNRLQAVRNGEVTRYIYDIAGNLLAEADGTNTITRYYIHGLGLLAMVEPTGETYTYHYNGIGSTIAMTDQDKNMVNKYFYTAFGLLANEEETIPQSFKYAGQYGIMYELNGLYYMRARYYDPEVGRFISEDPIGFDGQDVNLYAYVSNNPISFVDPWGLARIPRRPLDNNIPFINGKGRVSHSQIWYDSGENSGFFNDDSIRSDIGHTIDEYDFSDSVHYDDTIMRWAEQNVQETWDTDWRMTLNIFDWNNCHDYTDAAIAEYNRIEQGDLFHYVDPIDILDDSWDWYYYDGGGWK